MICEIQEALGIADQALNPLHEALGVSSDELSVVIQRYQSDVTAAYAQLWKVRNLLLGFNARLANAPLLLQTELQQQAVNGEKPQHG